MTLTSLTDRPSAQAQIDLALINNMPDSAFENTERQFHDLLAHAAGSMEVRLRFFYLPEIARAESVRRRISDHYCELHDLWDSGLDAVIVTGTEPRTSDLRQEVYWNSLVNIIDWAKTETVAAIWSCLAAHAAVLHLDGIARQPLPDKCFGVFEHDVTAHRLTRALSTPQRTPHSHWNAVSRPQLEASDYQILTESHLAGVDLFIKEAPSLFVFWQGHPEYDTRSLLKEYQRDVQRFVRHEREKYPRMPYGYFSKAATAQLAAFEVRALAARHESLVSEFPFAAASAGLENTWRASAIQFYQNWLAIILDAKTARGKRRRGPSIKQALRVPD